MYPFRDLKGTTKEGHSGIHDLAFLQVRAIVSPIFATSTVLTERHFTCFVAGSRSLELVPQTTHGDDELRVRVVRLDLGSQPLDVDVQGLGVTDIVAAPHPVDQLCAGQHPAAVAQ